MTDQDKTRALRSVLPVIGVIFVFGIWSLMRLWPAGWQWQPNQHEYEQMFQGVYATLGIFLIWAARAPRQHRSLIMFTPWSSLVHVGVMAVQAIRDAADRGHLIGDVPALALVGIVLLILTPRSVQMALGASNERLGPAGG